MDRRTVRVYERGAREWIARRRPRALADGRLDAFAGQVVPGGRVADLGCGPGWYARALGERGLRPVGLDISGAMLAAARERSPDLSLVRADLAALPFADGSLDGAWGSACYMHLSRADLPTALARVHGALARDAPLWLTLTDLEALERARPADLARGDAEIRDEREPFGGRLFSAYTSDRAEELLEGAAFGSIEVERSDGFWLWVRARREWSLPDWIRPRLRLLVCGLNPSPYSADAGVPFARPGNRFWPAARAAGLVERERDPWSAVGAGLGFTDCVKRTTARASEVGPDEYRAGVGRVERLIRRYRPAATCFVGLEGFRRAVDRRARPGWLEEGFAERPAYLMPSTSGLNTHETLESLTHHLRRVAQGPRAQRG